MKQQMCSRCGERPAGVFRLEERRGGGEGGYRGGRVSLKKKKAVWRRDRVLKEARGVECHGKNADEWGRRWQYLVSLDIGDLYRGNASGTRGAYSTQAAR